MPEFLGFEIKDWLLLAVIFILIGCLSNIRRLRKTISKIIQKNILPQLFLYMDKKELFFCLKNEGFSVVRNIEIEDSGVTVQDAGYNLRFILKFDKMEFLQPKQEAKLKFRVFDEKNTFLPEPTERLFPHLLKPTFDIALACLDFEGRRYRFLFSKKEDNFYTKRIESL